MIQIIITVRSFKQSNKARIKFLGNELVHRKKIGNQHILRYPNNKNFAQG